MPSPRYRFGGSFRKFGTDSYAMSGTFSAFALLWARSGWARNTAIRTKPAARQRCMNASGGQFTRLFGAERLDHVDARRPRCRQQGRDDPGGGEYAGGGDDGQRAGRADVRDETADESREEKAADGPRDDAGGGNDRALPENARQQMA